MDLFRTNAVNHLNTLSETEPYLRIIKPASWVWVLTAMLFLLGFLIWGVWGQILVDVLASGIILPENSQVLPIYALSQGSVAKVYVKPGDLVRKGDLLAEIANPYVDTDLTYLETIYNNNEKLLAEFTEQYNNQKKNLNEQFQQQTLLLNENLKNAQEKTEMLKDLYAKKEMLFKKHYLTIPEVEKGKEDYISAQDELSKIRLAINEAPIKFKEAQNQLDEKMNQQLSKYLASKHELDTKLLDKRQGSKIVSATSGTIMGSSIVIGDYIATGKTLLTIMTNSTESTLDALVFINHQEGKKIAAGMEAFLLPSSLTAYDYGYIKGKVVSVSEYPASKESVFSYLGNASLVDEFFAGGVPFLAKIRLEKNNNNASGLSWTTKRGTPFKIKPGTTVSVKIITKKGSPLGLLTKYSTGG